MARPVVWTVDDDPEVLRAVAHDLRRQYGERFRVMRADSGPAARVRAPAYNHHGDAMKNAAPAARVLVADDQADVREALRMLLKAEGYAIETAASPAELLSALQKREVDVARGQRIPERQTQRSLRELATDTHGGEHMRRITRRRMLKQLGIASAER